MSDKDHDLLITQFQDITGQDAERSRFYLESSGWDVEMSLGRFYENDAMDVEDLEAARPQETEALKADERPKSDKAGTGPPSRLPASNISTFSSMFGSS